MSFINDDFMLSTKSSRRLYHDYAEGMPIIDYHCHLSPEEVAQDKKWENLTQVWLYGDHYKWRQMRTNGVEERYCTGDASDREKFDKWAGTMSYLLRNPLYHWTQLELKRYFDVDDLLGPATADRIWDTGKKKLAEPGFSARGLMERSGVVLVCTTDSPVDSLEFHKAVSDDHDFGVQMLPAWRPDDGMATANVETFNAWVDLLGEVSDVDTGDFEGYLEALRNRHQYFHDAGCRLSDHGLNNIRAEDYSSAEIETVFGKLRAGKAIDSLETAKFESAMLHEFAVMDAEKGWVQQIHYGIIRNNNSRMFKSIGANTGFDSIGSYDAALALSRFMDRLAGMGRLPKTILYNANPCDNEVLATMAGNFQDGSVPGKIQLGSGWWFMDQIDGMRRQMEAVSHMGLLSRFVGMLTDSRSFLSYTRHEYFRRILCDLLGSEMERGLIPNDIDWIGGMVQDISYNNAASYFGFNLQEDTARG